MAVEGASGGGRDDHHGASSSRTRGKKRYHRHTTEQIQLLDATFNECPHPDEKLRLQLSQELGLTPRQIKFWFQNRRTQLKVKSEMADNSLLKEENEKIRSENIAIKEALKNSICSTCGGPPGAQGDCHEEQRLRYENAHLKEELNRVSSMVSKYIGRPLMSQSSPAHVEQSHLFLPDLSMVNYVGATQQRMLTMAGGGSSLELDLLTSTGIRASASNTIHPRQPLLLTGMHKSRIADVASSALNELMRLIQSNEPFWTISVTDGRDVLDIDHYEQIFPRPNTSIKNPNLWIEASRATADVMINSFQLVEMLNDSTKLGDLFPTIVSKARTIEVISSGSFGDQSGSLQLMYEELQVASPLVPMRKFIFIRFCQQIAQETWAVVDFSYDLPQDNDLPYSQLNSRRLPSGCLIQSMPNGYSKVTWIEHVEIEEETPVHKLYRDLIYSGLAFGAERWVACLQRSCERIAFEQTMTNSICELGGVIQPAEGKKSIMKLAQRMVKNFCANISPCDGHLWSCVSDCDNFEVYATLYKSANCVQPNTSVLCAAATIWLPHSPQIVFDFLRDEKNRHQWDVLANHNPVQEVTHITNGAPGNCISVLKVQNATHGSILILQESCKDSSGSLVVYCPVDLNAMNVAMRGDEPFGVPLLPSGFAITTDGNHKNTISTSGNTTGSLVTLVLQTVVSGLPQGKLGAQSVATINNLIGSRVRDIKAAMINCSSSTT